MMRNNPNTKVTIESYTYNPKIDLEVTGLWLANRRFVQNVSAHLLSGSAWSSHQGFLYSSDIDCCRVDHRDYRRRVAKKQLLGTKHSFSMGVRAVAI